MCYINVRTRKQINKLISTVNKSRKIHRFHRAYVPPMEVFKKLADGYRGASLSKRQSIHEISKVHRLWAEREERHPGRDTWGVCHPILSTFSVPSLSLSLALALPALDVNLDEFHQNKRTLLIRANLIRNSPWRRIPPRPTTSVPSVRRNSSPLSPFSSSSRPVVLTEILRLYPAPFQHPFPRLASRPRAYISLPGKYLQELAPG